MLREKLPDLIIFISIYIVFFFFILYICKYLKRSKVTPYIVTILMIIFAGIRYNVGSDYDTFYKQYQEIGLYFSSVGEIINSSIQFAHNLLNYLVNKLWGYEYGIFWIYAIIIYIPYFKRLFDESKDYLEAMFIYFTMEFHLISLNLLKQATSMTFYYRFVGNLNKKKYLRCIADAILMIIFHISSIIPIIFTFIGKKIKPTLTKMYVVTILSCIMIPFYKTVILLIPFPNNYYNYIYSINKEYYIVYIGAFIYLLSTTFILWKLLRKKDKLIQLDSKNEQILSLLILSIPFKVLALDNFPIYRISLYFDQFLIIIIPMYLKVMKEINPNYNKNYILYFIFMMFFLIVTIVFIPHNNFYAFDWIFNH